MKNQFDRGLNMKMKENLDNIHASEDLIARTLTAVSQAEQNSSVTEPGQAAVLSAVDQNYVMSYMTKKGRKRLLIAAIASVAAIICMMAGLIAMIRSSDNKQEISPVTASGVMEAEMPSSIKPCSAYDPELSYYRTRGLSGRARMEMREGGR